MIFMVVEIFCILTVALSVSWLSQFTVVLQSVTVGKNLKRDTGSVCVISTTVYDSTIISKYKSNYK